ncbi:MAG TPA: glycosyltransferase family 39 protein, partial [Solirubrobacteraceae bacterium]|nr:glycosyltransferase family 39 protein [Solirubrobacteraceae bacterium]
MATAEVPRRWAWPALAIVLAGGLALRLWGVQQGLPYAFNADEADHFVPRAVHMFGHSLNPHYFANPPGFTYVLHYLFALAYGGTTGVRHAFALHPADLYTLARIAAAVLGVGALWLLYAIGARLFSRAVGLLAAAIEAVAFLPVFYAHLALNDAPTLAPLTLSLLGTAGVLRKGRKRDYLLAGLGLGLACATKYTAGIVIVPFAAAVAARYLDGGAQQGGDREGTGRSPIDRSGSGRQALVGIAVCAAAALVAFLIANPYSLLDYQRFHSELVHQSTLSAPVAAQQQADPRRPLDSRHRRATRHCRPQPGARRCGEGGAHAREPHPPEQRRGLPTRQRRLLRGDRRCRRRCARPDPASRLQAHLHEPLLRDLWQLLRSL